MKFLIAVCLSFISMSCLSQVDTTLPPYKRFPTLPPIQLLLSDSTTKYTKENIPKKKQVLLMLFSPECSHCQHTAEEMLKYKEELKDIHIIMATFLPLKQMNDFVETYRLKEMENVVVGKDIFFIIPPFYGVKSLPFLAFYDKKGDLIHGFEGSMPVGKIIDVFKNRK